MPASSGDAGALRGFARRRWPFFLVLDLLLFAAGFGLLLCLLQRGVDTDQIALNDRDIQAFVKGWTADGTSLAGRRVTILVADSVETGRVLDLPGGKRARGWWQWVLRRTGLAKKETFAGLFEGAGLVPEWTVETRGWAARRDEIVSALASQVMSVVEAHGTVDLVVQGEVADLALAAARGVEKLAPPESRHLLRKVVVLGASSASPPQASFEKPGRVKEWVFFWREKGGFGGSEVTVKAEAHTRLFKGEVFDGEDLLFTAPPKQGWYSDKEILMFVQRLLQSDLAMEDYMMLAQHRPPTPSLPASGTPSASPAPGVPSAPVAPHALPGPGILATEQPGFMPFPVPATPPARPPLSSTGPVDSSSLVRLGSAEQKAPEEAGKPPAPKGGVDLASLQPLRLIDLSVGLAFELAKRNAERAELARASKREKMADYSAAKAAVREAAAREAAAKAAREAAAPEDSATEAPPPTASAPPTLAMPKGVMPKALPSSAPLKGGTISPFKSGPKVGRKDLEEPLADP
ncbi:MAG: hypothetical protein HZB91_14210 [Elusimicrobia bacterium]|nr:hypothetical protein [Elusimicrobiota bacterium]